MARPDPYVFISHKHSDAPIANVVSSFLTKASAGLVRVHNSSSSDFEGPRIGKNLNDELKHALARAQVLILVFTSEGEDWQYCMWECGVATDPRDEHPTDVIVFQCGKDIPKTYGDSLRVLANDITSIRDFTKDFLTHPDFFPGRNAPIAQLPEAVIKEQADDLFEDLQEVLPDLGAVTSDFNAATYLQIELPATSIAAVRASARESRSSVLMDVLSTTGRIMEEDRAKPFFGFGISAGAGFGDVLEKWRSTTAGGTEGSEWVDSLARQIELAILDQYPQGVPWAPIKKDGSLSIIPYVTQSRTLKSGAMQFDTQFVPLAPQPLSVSNRMIGIAEMYSKNLETTHPAEIRLYDLISELDEDHRTRLPVLGEGGRPKYVIHSAMIHQFTSKRAFDGQDVKLLTLDDLLADAELEALFASTFAVVSPQATLAEARDAMEALQGSQDVFVTVDGSKEAKMVGWLTNVMFLDV